jgi:hypothetical protein
MLTNYHINHELLEEARNLGGHDTKVATINEALEKYVEWLNRCEIIKHFGTFDFEPEFLEEQDRKRQPR